MVVGTSNRRNCLKMTLCKLWQILFILTINGYLIYVTISDYLKLKKQILDRLYDRDNTQWSTIGPMNLQLSCLIFSLSLLPITILTILIPTGNLANDSHVLGHDIDNNQFLFDSDSKGRLIRIDSMFYAKSNSSLLNRKIRYQNKLFKQQFLPISIFLQILISLGYLLPLPFIEGQRIYEGILRPNALWHTDLDFIVDPDRNHPQFTNHNQWNYQQPLHPAYFYLLVNLALLMFQYPRVFWRTNRHFCLLFCISIFVFALQLAIDFSSLSVLVKLAYNRHFLAPYVSPCWSSVSLAILFSAFSLICLLLPVTLFNYGLNQYFQNLTRHRMNLRLKFKSSSHVNRFCTDPDMIHMSELDQLKTETVEDHKNHQDNEQIDDNDDRDVELQHEENQVEEDEEIEQGEQEEEDDGYHNDRVCDSKCCNKYASVTTALIMAVVAGGLKCPIVLDCLRLYKKTDDKIMHLNLVTSGMVGAFWLILWFGLSLRDKWEFKVAVRSRNDSKSLHQQASTQMTHAAGGGNNIIIPSRENSLHLVSSRVGHQGNSLQRSFGSTPVYASCNQIIHTPLSRRSQIGGITIEEDTMVSELANGYNYVLLHNGTPLYSTNGRVVSPQTINPATSSIRSNSNNNLQSLQNTTNRQLQHKSMSPTSSEFGGGNNLNPLPAPATILLSDDLLGSEKSFGSSSIVARSFTLQDKVNNNTRHDSISSSLIQNNDQLLTSPNRYYKTVPTSSLVTNSYNCNQPINNTGSILRSPILSYQNSPTEKALSPNKIIGVPIETNSYQHNIANYNKQQIELMEPDIISHRIIINADANNDVTNNNNKYIENEYDAVESSELLSNSDNGNVAIKSNNETLIQKNISNNSNDLNNDFQEDDEGRLCSQV